MRKLLLRSFQSPGDVLMLSAAVRDLHVACPESYQTDVRTSADAIWENNPWITALEESNGEAEPLDMHYPAIHQSNQRPYHFIHGYAQYLEHLLGVRVPVTRFCGDIHLSREEIERPCQLSAAGYDGDFWIIVAGGKYDFTAKWWDPECYQQVVDHFADGIQFVQCGEEGHWHPPLANVINLVGKTTLRQFIVLMHHASGVVCPVTFAMHLAAAVPTRPGKATNRACVVIAGGREPPHWEAYPHHQFISTNGALACCAEGGCWKSRCQLVGDGDPKDQHGLCEQPVQVTEELRIPRCMHLITPADVIRRIEMYYEGGALSYLNGAHAQAAIAENGRAVKEVVVTNPSVATPRRRQVLLEFRHGIGDAVQFTSVLAHLKKYRPEWEVDVISLLGKHSAFVGHCRNTFVLDQDQPNRAAYDDVFPVAWHESVGHALPAPATKAERCLREVFDLTPDVELCRYMIAIGDEDHRAAREYLETIAGPPLSSGHYRSVLLHYQGNMAVEQKNVHEGHIASLCLRLIEWGFVPVILDWDYRNRLADNQRVFCPDKKHPLWLGYGTGDAARIAALIEHSTLCVAIDSGPQKIAGATTTPTVAVWRHHHPIHFFAHAENVVHLVPTRADGLIRGPCAPQLNYFRATYKQRTCEYRQDTHDREEALRTGLTSVVKDVLEGGVPSEPYWASWRRMMTQLMPADLADFGWCVEEERAKYRQRFDLAERVKPRRMLEIGVRAGYGAWAFLSGCPAAAYTGWDDDSGTFGGRPGAVAHARAILAPFNARIEQRDSLQATAIEERYDLVHIDGNHDYEACAHDLGLALGCAACVLVDDYFNLPSVNRACRDTARRVAADWRITTIDDGGSGMCLFERKPS